MKNHRLHEPDVILGSDVDTSNLHDILAFTVNNYEEDNNYKL